MVPLKTTLGSFSNIKEGDCMVTFSRLEIYKLKVGILQGTIVAMLGTYDKYYLSDLFDISKSVQLEAHTKNTENVALVWEKRSET